MRLIDIKQNIDIAKEFFTPSFPSSNGNYYVDNVLKTKKAIEALIKIHILPTNVEDEKVFIDVIQSAFTNRIIVNSSQQSDFIKVSTKIRYMITTLSLWLNDYLTTDETDTSINIKLPSVSGLSDFSEVINLLEKSFN